MAITAAVQRGAFVHVFGENNRPLFTQNGELAGYTSSTVSIRRSRYIYVFNEKGVQIGSHFE